MKFIAIFWFSGSLLTCVCFLRLNVVCFSVDSLVSVSSTRGCEKFPFLYETRKKKELNVVWRNFRPFLGFYFSADFCFETVVALCVCVSTSYQDLLSPKSHRVFPCPLASQFSVLFPVSFKYSGDFWDKWIIGIWITQQGTDGEQHFGNGECWRPL